ncbi:hypothetical protein BD414DRAFT_484113 [Trametes punicea]|nr:hypothetical protein BD414DRAFT_484113 [Trametes punicea]
MAFAQFHYDPALEFERLLEDDGTESTLNAALVDGPPRVAGPTATKSKSTGAITRPTSTRGERCPPRGVTTQSRWFGEGLVKRRAATTGSMNGGSHPVVPK